MVFNAFKKVVLITILFFISVSLSNAQNKIKAFSEDYSVYLNELSEFMFSSDNNDLKSNFKNFKKISSKENYTDSQKNKIISISNRMLKKRYKASTHFNNFVLCLTALHNNSISNDKVSDWLEVVSTLVDEHSSKKLLVYFYFSIDLVNENILRETKTTSWVISSKSYDFFIKNNEPFISFSDVDLTCSSDGGKIVTFSTSGSYFPYSYKIIGKGGKMDWSQQGLSSDSIYVILDGYSLDVRTAAIQADSVLFTNKLMFSFSLKGSFVDKITRGKQAENYPKFVFERLF